MQGPGLPTPGQPSAIRPPIASNNGAGILTCFPSATHFCLALGADSPYADERCVGNLALSARGLFTPFNATHVSIRTSDTSSRPRGPPSQAYRTLSYHAHCCASTASVSCLSPVHYRRRTPRPVSYYALFKWWLLLSQHPGCPGGSTSFRTEHVLGTLAGGLGCSPLDNEAYPPLSSCHVLVQRYSEFGLDG